MIESDKNGIKILLYGLIFAFVLLQPFLSSAKERVKEPEPASFATIYLFWGEGCPHCDKAKEFLHMLERKYPAVTVKEYEVWHVRENTELFERFMKSARVQSPGVPATVVGKTVFIGFSEQTAKNIEGAVELCLQESCPDSLRAMMSENKQPGEEQKKQPLTLFVDVDPTTISLPLFTVIVGAVDSFNPCSFFVLLFLLSMLIHAGSRKKMLLIGSVFVFFSGVMYFLFMAAWLNVFLIIGKLTLITATAGVIALGVASLNIKDFFFFKKGFSLAIPDKSRPRLFEQTRNLITSSSLTRMIGGTIVLAITANTYELLCTAGFPMIYTRTLTLHKLTALQYYLYLVLYNIVYVVPLAVIVLVITITLGARKLTEWQGRQLKLISGLMMLFLGGILLVNPALLNNALASMALLASALILSAITIYAAKKWKPEIAMR